MKLAPGTRIYFYETEDENVMIGPKLQSEEDIVISIMNQGEDLNNYCQSETRNSVLKPVIYSALKSGVLVPKRNGKKVNFGKLFKDKQFNKCVYQSVKPTYYIKGFKNILIPVDVLYSKSKRDILFRNKGLDERSLTLPKLSNSISKDTQKEGNWQSYKFDGKDVPFKKICSFGSSMQNSFHDSPKFKVKPQKSCTFSRKPMFNITIGDPDDEIKPDETCNGEVTLFVLKNDGVFTRAPADPYIPVGLRLSYSLLKNLMLKPRFLGGSDVIMSYVTGNNGDLLPHSENLHKVTAEVGNSVSFMLSRNGGLFPVREERQENKVINYYFNGNLVHQSQQFTETFSNSTSILVNNKKMQLFDSEDAGLPENKIVSESEPTHHHLQKRATYYNYDNNGQFQSSLSQRGMRQQQYMPEQTRIMEYSPQKTQLQYMQRDPAPVTEHVMAPTSQQDQQMSQKMQSYDENTKGISTIRHSYTPSDMYEPQKDEIATEIDQSWETLKPRTDIFIFDEKGTRIRLIPEITENNDVVIYKLTCKGNLVRYPPCKEPEHGFGIHFQLLLDEFVLVPVISNSLPYHIKYTLQENGDLTPSEDNVNTFRKAPGSLIYYMLGKNNILFPVQQVVDMEGYVSFYYQDFFILKMKDSVEKPLHFTTKGAPMFAFFNKFTLITSSSKPRLNPLRGSNWKHLKPAETLEKPTKTMYLTGPKGELIRIAPYKNKQGATVVYELDCNGIFYRSPKDKKKCIILKSYILMKEGILIPSNDTNGYVYMMSKNGDLFPYLYPDGKIEAPMGTSLKYVLCEKGILLPIKLEIIDNSVCYLFRDVVVYKERVFCKTCLDRMGEDILDPLGQKKSSCDMKVKDMPFARETNINLFVNKNGESVFYEKNNKVLKRCPPEEVPTYLKYTMGSFEVKPDGSLFQIRYQDPSENVVNLMLEPNGDLLEDTRNINNVRSQYYVLDAKGNLISVEGRKTEKFIYFYKNHLRVCRAPLPTYEIPKSEPAPVHEAIPPLGRDPLGLMDDPFPVKDNPAADSRSLYIPIPLKSVSIAETPGSGTPLDCGDPEHKKKCDLLKDTLKQVSKGMPLALELELTDDILEELKNWAAKCDKVLSRREIAEEFKNYLEDFSSGRLGGDNSKAR